tara:strand:- start:3758 stop:4237 length:480 start_codon:yes stop_codon:yes gene_type:complete
MKRPWNIINLPIYSLATYDETDNLNMNICSYVSAVSLKPKLYSIAIDYSTKTYENLKLNSFVVLQLLSKSHLKIIRKLGKTSGYLFNKEKYLRSKEMLEDWRRNIVLKDTCALIELKKINEINIEGDHAIFTFSVSKYTTLSEDGILTFRDLIANKIIL